jgi:hypothetical protein
MPGEVCGARVVVGSRGICAAGGVVCRRRGLPLGAWEGASPPGVLAPLGLRRSPSVATLHRRLRMVSVAEVRAALAAFARALHRRRTGRAALGVVAVDGKTSRGVRERDAQLHVLQLFAQANRLVLDQVVVGSGVEEKAATRDWLITAAAPFPGLSVPTGDAMYVELDLCAPVVAGQCDDVLRLTKTSSPAMPTSNASSPPRPPARRRPGEQGARPPGAAGGARLGRVYRLQPPAGTGASGRGPHRGRAPTHR